MTQLEENILVANLELSKEEVNKLNEVSRTVLPYPQWMFAFTTRDRQLSNKIIRM